MDPLQKEVVVASAPIWAQAVHTLSVRTSLCRRIRHGHAPSVEHRPCPFGPRKYLESSSTWCTMRGRASACRVNTIPACLEQLCSLVTCVWSRTTRWIISSRKLIRKALDAVSPSQVRHVRYLDLYLYLCPNRCMMRTQLDHETFTFTFDLVLLRLSSACPRGLSPLLEFVKSCSLFFAFSAASAARRASLVSGGGRCV